MKKNTLSIEARNIFLYIVERIAEDKIQVGNPHTYLGYGQIHQALCLDLMGNTIGQSLSYQGLGDLADFLKENSFPALTSVVIDIKTLLPGGDFFKMHNRTKEDFAWWESEVRKSVEFDWALVLAQLSTRS